jgi:GT2 family glycosyltransferase
VTDVNATITAIIVSFSDPEATRRAVESLLDQSHPPIEILLADNHPDRRTATAMRGWAPDARVRLVHSGANLGYTGACNTLAAQARGEWLLFLNPDARADPSCLATLLGAVDPTCGVAGPQVLLPDGRTNAGDNPVHITGIAWSGRFGEPREYGLPREVGSVSGAALLARAEAFREAGGMCEHLFMYEDDVDLCWRVRLTGWKVMFCPDAVVWHEYEFDKGTMKWFWLERNRQWTVLSNYSAITLVLLAPLLLGAELMVLAQAIRGRWIPRLFAAWGSTMLGVGKLVRWRRRVQRSRKVGDREIVELMSGRIQTSLLESPLTIRVNPLLAAYRRILLGVLGAIGR